MSIFLGNNNFEHESDAVTQGITWTACVMEQIRKKSLFEMVLKSDSGMASGWKKVG